MNSNSKEIEDGREGRGKAKIIRIFFRPFGDASSPPFPPFVRNSLHTRKSLKTGRDSSFAHYRAILRERSRGMIGEQRVSVFSRTLRPKCLTLASAQKGGREGVG